LALEKRRLKISRFLGVNDPFEFLGVTLSNPELRTAIGRTIEQLNRKRGMLCFSSRWTNPVMWSHYADRHRGLCLGFEIPGSLVEKVKYVSHRFSDAPVMSGGTENEKIEFMKRVLCTKFSHWKYENEYRSFVSLDEPEGDLFFADFSEKMKLKRIVVGSASELSRSQIQDALGTDADDIPHFKARLAFRSFSVVRNRNSALWK
jgi:Protein of unknown function (DUF2971)